MSHGDEERETPEDTQMRLEWWRNLDDILMDHFREAYDAEWMSHLLNFDVAHEIPEVWNKGEVHALLDVLENATLDIAAVMDFKLPVLVDDAIRLISIRQVYESLGEAAERLSKLELHTELENNSSFKLVKAWEAISEHAEHVHTTLEKARQTTEAGIAPGKKNIEGWRLVSAAAKLCEIRYPGSIKVPKYMNEAGPFYALLVDLMLHYEVEGDPVSAFRAWRRYVDSSDAKKGDY